MNSLAAVLRRSQFDRAAITVTGVAAGIVLSVAPSWHTVLLIGGTAILAVPALQNPARLGTTILVVYALAVGAAGRSFGLMGSDPVYLHDVLLLAATVLLVVGAVTRVDNSFDHQARHLVAAASILVIVLVSVAGALEAGRGSALKGGSMGIYPMCAVLIGTSTRLPERFRSRTLLLFLVAPVGVAVSLIVGAAHSPASALGLYLSIAIAVGVTHRDVREGRLLLGASGAAAVYVALELAKRGPVLAITVATGAAWLLTRGTPKQGSARVRAASAVALVAAAVGWLGMVAVEGAGESRTTEFGARVLAGIQDEDSEAANNVELRFARWDYATDLVRRKPLTGAGAGAPMLTHFEGGNLTEEKVLSGPHNSFIGYAFYFGLPCLALVLYLIGAAIRRLWRTRKTPVHAASLAAILAVVLTAMTNDALESPYISAPSWLLIGLALRGTAHRKTKSPG